jgi:hypothetical protein
MGSVAAKAALGMFSSSTSVSLQSIRSTIIIIINQG